MSEATKDGNDSKAGTIVLFLEKFGYTVNDTSGKTNYFYNIFEFLIQSVYFGLSLFNAIGKLNPENTISLVTLAINVLVLAKIWVKNMKNANRADKGKQNIKELESFCGVVRVQVKVYERKMIFTNAMLVMAGALIVYSQFFGYTSVFDPKAIIGIIVVVTSFIDGILNILENMYQAIPKNYYVLTMIDGR